SAKMIEEQKVEITVSDNGIGMSEETMKQIFDPFFTTRRGNGGTGLGLHLTYQLVSQLLGGKITVSSTLGKGSVFSLTIPVTAPEAAEQNLN
ncbi:MAG: HAMP domain-containing histidine kinase, partial [Shewanella sp.]|nr:HAMP domain-containing histidine kinase [Shewanella sp.]